MKILKCISAANGGDLLIPIENIAYILQDPEKPTEIFLNNFAIVRVCETAKELNGKILSLLG